MHFKDINLPVNGNKHHLEHQLFTHPKLKSARENENTNLRGFYLNKYGREANLRIKPVIFIVA